MKLGDERLNTQRDRPVQAMLVVTLAVISLNITPTQSELQSRLEPACSRPHPSKCTVLVQALSAAVAQRPVRELPLQHPLQYKLQPTPQG